mgnify:FL=1
MKKTDSELLLPHTAQLQVMKLRAAILVGERGGESNLSVPHIATRVGRKS